MKKILYILIVAISFSCSEDENFDAENIADIEAYLLENNLNAQKTGSDLYYIISNSGNGNSPTFNSTVTVGYNGYFLDGTSFDSSESATFNLQQVVPGFSEGIRLLKPGGSGTFILPSKIAYGTRGSGTIQPGDIIVFDITLQRIN
ncbi:FKBP-type peptidyl-prolyl cis-trans isomerase [uncultured Polaribacter sp.]|uniref:FKBP-type peptidyl-prolyl cis-trans isomerase n=1 Tax=uncultured Polaribacter sp. TaxID=174711 RepID=UPI0026149945|nr:FKBP-type peptidyl-prolyl cis-trans isomerase [uncultured Polaribacter sp.]